MRRYVSFYIDSETYDHYFVVTFAPSEQQARSYDQEHDILAAQRGWKALWVARDSGQTIMSEGYFPKWVDKARQEACQ